MTTYNSEFTNLLGIILEQLFDIHDLFNRTLDIMHNKMLLPIFRDETVETSLLVNTFLRRYKDELADVITPDCANDISSVPHAEFQLMQKLVSAMCSACTCMTNYF